MPAYTPRARLGSKHNDNFSANCCALNVLGCDWCKVLFRSHPIGGILTIAKAEQQLTGWRALQKNDKLYDGSMVILTHNIYKPHSQTQLNKTSGITSRRLYLDKSKIHGAMLKNSLEG